MSELNRIVELAGIPLMESRITESGISWKDQEEGTYLTATWNGKLGPITLLADGAEFSDGYWKIYINNAGYHDEVLPMSVDDLKTVNIALHQWLQRAKNVDFGDDSILPVNDIRLHIPTIKGVSMKQFGNSVSKKTGLEMIGIDENRKETVMDFRNTPIPYADSFKKQQLGKEENPYDTDSM